MKPKWFPNWSQETCTIVASGPSASSIDLNRAIGLTRFVVVNSSWQLAPWADFLFAADYKWWQFVKGCPDFKGWKVTTDRRAADEWDLLRLTARLADDRLQIDDNSVGWGGNSGFQAVNMVFHFGCKRILLVGFDVTTRHGLHWHNDYMFGNPNPGKALRWQRTLDGAHKVLSNLGVTVINCSQISRLKKYPKMSYEEACSR